MYVQLLLMKNTQLRQEIEGHEPRIQSVNDMSRLMTEEGHPQAEDFQGQVDELLELWNKLREAVEARRRRLELSQVAQQVRTTFWDIIT